MTIAEGIVADSFCMADFATGMVTNRPVTEHILDEWQSSSGCSVESEIFSFNAFSLSLFWPSPSVALATVSSWKAGILQVMLIN